MKIGDKVWFVGVRRDKPIYDVAEVEIDDIFLSNNKLFFILNFGKEKGRAIHLAENCYETKEIAEVMCNKRNKGE